MLKPKKKNIMKKKLHLFALVVFVSTMGLAACSDAVEPEPVMEQETIDIYDPRFTDGDEEDSTRGPGL